MTEINKRTSRIDALGKVTGQALFPGDYYFPNQLYMKVLFSECVHAKIKKIDLEEANKLPGVVLILTAKDVPNNEYGLIVPDQPVLCGPGSKKENTDRVRFIGDQVALVIAESEEIAEEAKKLIKVTYEELPIISDCIESMKQESFLLHPERKSNVFGHFQIRKGEVEDAFKKADVVIEGTYHTPVQEHAYLQPEAGVSYIDEEDRITVVVAGQWAHEDQEQIAHSLNLPPDRIRVIYPAIGGAFGGREDMSVQIILALASMKLKEKGINRPVKIVWTRRESIIGHHKRHAYHFKTRWGATKEGMLIAAEVEAIADGGAYIYTSTKVLGNATLMCTGPYFIPNVRVDSYAVYTNNIPGGAFRGFGGPQGAFVAENQMNKLAEALGMDPVEIRMKNVLHEGMDLSVGTPLPLGVTIDKVVDQCAKSSGWVQNGKYLKPDKNKNEKKRRGIGFACAFKNIGFSFGAPENCWAIIELHGESEIEKAILRHAGAEVGQGTHTAMIQMAAEALSLPITKINLIASDTAATRNSGSVSASRMTFMAGNAIKGAAALVLEKWKNEERPSIAEFQYIAPKTTPYDPETGKAYPNISYGYVAESVECEVDTETGQIKLTNVICVDDVGKAVNPTTIEGQIEGAVVQAAGYTLMENFIQKDGRPLTDKFSTYLIPTNLDIPDRVESVILEYPDPRGPFGVRGMGEMPYLPFAPAVVAAVHDATGIWFDEFPLTAERVYKRLKGINK